MGNDKQNASGISVLTLERQEVSQQVMKDKYLINGVSSVDQLFETVATAVAAVEEPEKRQEVAVQFRALLESGFTGGGRIMANAGRRGILATMINCFVQPVGDSMTAPDHNGMPGIFTALAQASETMRRGGGVGYNFSRIRPKGAIVRGTNSTASGPLSYMDTFNAMCATVESAGSRRGAQMGVLNVSHPDISDFITAKSEAGRLTNFNVSVAVSAAFMDAVERGARWELVHEAEPNLDMVPEAYCRDDGQWVYQTVNARELWDAILRHTYDYAEPGIIYLDRVNQLNNLYYTETIEASNPCAEEMLPPFGCCCVGSADLTRFVVDPFSANARFDFDGYKAVAGDAVRFLDNVLDATVWPLEEQREEARLKRRIGQGFYGLGDAMVMLGMRYGDEASIAFTEQVACAMRDASYLASIELAMEKGAFPLFDRDAYLAGEFAQTLPEEIREGIYHYGIRNSHLGAIAPTGTMALTFGDNASNGIEPPFAFVYQRNIKQADGSSRKVAVLDRALRIYLAMNPQFTVHGTETIEELKRWLPASFVGANELSVDDHLNIVAAAQRYLDTSVSKTVNVPTEMSFEEFREVYRRGYDLGLKCVSTYRPSGVRGAVLEVNTGKVPEVPVSLSDDPDRRLVIKPSIGVGLGELRWPHRPETPNGAESKTYWVSRQQVKFGVTVAHYENGTRHPFEVFVQGAEAPRGLHAISKLLSMDMRSKDKRWLKRKLDVLLKTSGSPFDFDMPPNKRNVSVGSASAALAKLVQYRATELGYFTDEDDSLPSPMLDALTSNKEPKTGSQGNLAWYTDIRNHGTGDDFVMMVKEATLEDGSRFPFSVWLTGDVPAEWEGLSKLLSLDMRLADPRWIAAKLKSIAEFPEVRGDFWAPVPGSDKQACYPSTIAYIAQLLLWRYRQLGILDENHEPVAQRGLFASDAAGTGAPIGVEAPMGFKSCQECHAHMSVIKADGCERCTACGNIGSCG